MNTTPDQRGAALLCDLDGRVWSVIRDDLGLVPEGPLGRPLAELVDPSAATRVTDFLWRVRMRGAAFGWECLSPAAHGSVLLYLSGARVDGRLLVFLSVTSPSATTVFDDFVRVNNEQANALRRTAKALFEARREAGKARQG